MPSVIFDLTNGKNHHRLAWNQFGQFGPAVVLVQVSSGFHANVPPRDSTAAVVSAPDHPKPESSSGSGVVPRVPRPSQDG